MAENRDIMFPAFNFANSNGIAATLPFKEPGKRPSVEAFIMMC
jgi:hypothetical protein